VNISNRAEIIEPDPLPLLLLASQNQSSLLDDDEVFSDSLPPPKRESMCAPYLEGDVVSENLFFAHGLPSWFEDERLNEMYEALSEILFWFHNTWANNLRSPIIELVLLKPEQVDPFRTLPPIVLFEYRLL